MRTFIDKKRRFIIKMLENSEKNIKEIFEILGF